MGRQTFAAAAAAFMETNGPSRLNALAYLTQTSIYFNLLFSHGKFKGCFFYLQSPTRVEVSMQNPW